MSTAKRPNPLFRNLNAKIAALPMIATTLVVFLGCSIWTVIYSFSKSRALPLNEFVGFAQYERLFRTSRWLISMENIVIYGVLTLIISFVIGFVLAALIDQKIRFEDAFRTIYLYPFALSFIVTGIVWQWILNPTLGIQETVRSWGFESFTFDLIANRETVLYALLIAGIWQGTGFVMVLMLAGIRGIDGEIWNATKVDGIPVWKTYLVVIVPMMRGVMVTTLVIVAAGIVKLYDLVVAMTQGGPGIASEVPAKYVYDFMFARGNVGQALAASTVMLTTVLIILIPWAFLEYGKKKAQR